MSSPRRLPFYGYVGLGVMGVSELLMALDLRPISQFFTPIVWTGYILAADGWLVKSGRSSYVRKFGAQFITLCVYSVFFWLLFEYYNFLLRNWYYQNLPESWTLRMVGYFWSFATILPGILITSELTRLIPGISDLFHWRIRATSRLLGSWVLVGLLFMIGPLVFPSPYFFAPVWMGIIFLLEPVNYMLGKASLLRDVEKGDWTNCLSVLFGGYICGFLWEFWNYWAHTKWVYTVPILPQARIFEMPILGFLGFGPFALECYVATNLIFSQPEVSHPQLSG